VAAKFVPETERNVFPIIESWCGEFTADIIAADALGAAPLLSLLGMEYCFIFAFPIYSASASHPATRWRLHVIDEFLSHKYRRASFLTDERRLYDNAWSLNLKLFVPDLANQTKEKSRHDKLFKHFILPIASEIFKEVAELKLPTHNMDMASLKRCVSRLKVGHPIAAQGAPREKLREEIARYSEMRFANAKARAAAFCRMCASFKEKPLCIPTILMAGHLRRLQIIGQLAKPKKNPLTAKVAKAFCERLAELDAVIGNSIATSTIHIKLNEVLNAAKARKVE
jgi:hypothetical protein